MLTLENVCASYGNTQIIRNVSLTISAGEIFGIVGESGCGKSTLLKTIMSLPGSVNSCTGKIVLNGKNIIELSKKEQANIWGNDISMIFQNPNMSMNPIIRIDKQFFETVKIHNPSANKKEVMEESRNLLRKMRFPNPDIILNSYPFQMSGGMNQRLAIALALINHPKLILADEPTSALDVTVQSGIIRLLKEVSEEFGTAILIVSHNMSVIANLASHIGVMYGGQMVELGKTEKVLEDPIHPYTRALLTAIPKMSDELPKSIIGNSPSFKDLTENCTFYPRCSFRRDLCNEKPPVRVGDDEHWWLCSNCKGGIDCDS